MAKKQQFEPEPRDTILTMLETRAATVPTQAAPTDTDHNEVFDLSDEEIDWTPEPLHRGASSPRSFRWSIVVLMLTMAAGVALLIGLAVQIPENRAATRLADYRMAVSAVDATIPETRAAINNITDPGSSLTDATQSIGATLQADERLAQMLGVATAPLPDLPPLIPSGPVDDLEPLRQRMIGVASRYEALNELVTASLGYRTSLAGLFQLPALPLTSSPQNVESLRVELSAAIAEDTAALSGLPDPEPFDQHLATVHALATWLQDWQVDYVDAVRAADTERAAELAEEARSRVDAVHESLSLPLQDVRDRMANELDQIEAELGQLLVLTSSG